MLEHVVIDGLKTGQSDDFSVDKEGMFWLSKFFDNKVVLGMIEAIRPVSFISEGSAFVFNRAPD